MTPEQEEIAEKLGKALADHIANWDQWDGKRWVPWDERRCKCPDWIDPCCGTRPDGKWYFEKCDTCGKLI